MDDVYKIDSSLVHHVKVSKKKNDDEDDDDDDDDNKDESDS